MSILNYTTKISPHKTVGEIQKILADHHATDITVKYETAAGLGSSYPVALSFTLVLQDRPVTFLLPCRWREVFHILKKSKVANQYRTEEQALRTAWRILKDWTEAQMAIIQSGMVQVAEVFLPYAQTPKGLPLWEELNSPDSNFILGNENHS